MTNRELLGYNIRTRRKNMGMSQAELGSAVGLTQAQISRLELGTSDTPSTNLDRLASVLCCSVMELKEDRSFCAAEDGSCRPAEGYGMPSGRDVVVITKQVGDTKTIFEIPAGRDDLLDRFLSLLDPHRDVIFQLTKDMDDEQMSRIISLITAEIGEHPENTAAESIAG